MSGRVPLLAGRRRPLIFAHRGCSSEAPENTMAAFRLARDYGAPGLELDIHRCASGELVVCHDASLLRTTGLDRNIEDCEWRELAALDAGAWFSQKFQGESLPLLDRVLDEFSQQMYIDIELKTKQLDSDHLPVTLVKLLRDHPSARPDRIVISSFNPFVLKAFKKIAPEYATAIIYCDVPETPWFLRHGQGRYLAGCDFLKPAATQATPLAIAALTRLGGRPMVAWTVDDAEAAARLIDIGCAGIITNRPQTIVPALGGPRPSE